jgi:hypothetical protein
MSLVYPQNLSLSTPAEVLKRFLRVADEVDRGLLERAFREIWVAQMSSLRYDRAACFDEKALIRDKKPRFFRGQRSTFAGFRCLPNSSDRTSA